MGPHLFPKLTHDPLKDILAVGTIAESANVLVVAPNSPWRTVQDLVRAGKVDPSKPLAYGTAGIASPQHPRPGRPLFVTSSLASAMPGRWRTTATGA